MKTERDCILLCVALTAFGCINRKANEGILNGLEGTWVGELSCVDEATRSTGVATLIMALESDKAVGDITYLGETPSQFTTTATLELWEAEGELDGRWRDCEIDYTDDHLTCHFWHQEQDNGYVFKPNTWSLSDDGSVFSIEEAGNVESEAMKCHGDLNLDE